MRNHDPVSSEKCLILSMKLPTQTFIPKTPISYREEQKNRSQNRMQSFAEYAVDVQVIEDHANVTLKPKYACIVENPENATYMLKANVKKRNQHRVYAKDTTGE